MLLPRDVRLLNGDSGAVTKRAFMEVKVDCDIKTRKAGRHAAIIYTPGSTMVQIIGVIESPIHGTCQLDT